MTTDRRRLYHRTANRMCWDLVVWVCNISGRTSPLPRAACPRRIVIDLVDTRHPRSVWFGCTAIRMKWVIGV